MQILILALAALWWFGGSLRAQLPAAPVATTPPANPNPGAAGLVPGGSVPKPFEAPPFPSKPTPQAGSTAAAQPDDYAEIWGRFRDVVEAACDKGDDEAVSDCMGMAGVVLLYARGADGATVGRITALASQAFEASCRRPWPRSAVQAEAQDKERSNREEAVGYVDTLAVGPTVGFLGSLLGGGG